jgi:hypothetical protein
MLESGNLLDPVLINTVGHAAGLLLFGLFTILLIRDWRAQIPLRFSSGEARLLVLGPVAAGAI